MSRRLLFFLVMIALLIDGNATESVAQGPSFTRKTWSIKRDIRDKGQHWHETAVYLQITRVTGRTLEATLWYYKKKSGANKHERQPKLELTGQFESPGGSNNKKRRTVILKDAGGRARAGVALWKGRRSSERDRVLIRLYSIGPTATVTKLPVTGCDDPPDDDILEEDDAVAPGEDPNPELDP